MRDKNCEFEMRKTADDIFTIHSQLSYEEMKGKLVFPSTLKATNLSLKSCPRVDVLEKQKA